MSNLLLLFRCAAMLKWHDPIQDTNTTGRTSAHTQGAQSAIAPLLLGSIGFKEETASFGTALGLAHAQQRPKLPPQTKHVGLHLLC